MSETPTIWTIVLGGFGACGIAFRVMWLKLSKDHEEVQSRCLRLEVALGLEQQKAAGLQVKATLLDNCVRASCPYHQKRKSLIGKATTS